ncbi:hypothetical protein PRJBM_00583 [Bartonella henselae]|nr:hypothetical protein Q654_00142 [Bartonella henselae JK 50]ETS10374.1 hypothetical protein Q655_00093 [Bartonella henselae JK 51]CDO39973.1 hypothetical protein PRJBM_00583 [Bartonella henselae]CUH90547.1 hypothetical protein BM1374164_00583 [Bartonella henselae]
MRAIGIVDSDKSKILNCDIIGVIKFNDETYGATIL